MLDHSEEFETQVIQIASLGVWHIVTAQPMSRRLQPVHDHRWQEKTGLFVTLKNDGKVRGSMGMLESTTLLEETLFDTGAAAATHDSRYAPILNEELKDIEIEVTLLSQIQNYLPVLSVS